VYGIFTARASLIRKFHASLSFDTKPCIQSLESPRLRNDKPALDESRSMPVVRLQYEIRTVVSRGSCAFQRLRWPGQTTSHAPKPAENCPFRAMHHKATKPCISCQAGRTGVTGRKLRICRCLHHKRGVKGISPRAADYGTNGAHETDGQQRDMPL
jgi:hypothetical protein